MHYVNNHKFVLGSVKKVWNSKKFTIDVPGVPGHYLYSNGDVSHSFDRSLTDNGFDWFYNSREDVQRALNLYNSKASLENAFPIIHQTIHQIDKVCILSKPQIASDTLTLWEVLSSENPNIALSKSNTIVHHAYRALFDTYQQALFAKLYYERTHKC